MGAVIPQSGLHRVKAEAKQQMLLLYRRTVTVFLQEKLV